MKFTYLVVDVAAVLIPLIFTFHKKIQFHREWKNFLPVLVIVSCFFIGWDAFFTHLGVWSFNPRYTLGSGILHLPIEEIMFFFCIPYACVFTYHCFKTFFSIPIPAAMPRIVMMTASGFIVVALFSYQRLYPLVTFLLLAIILLMVRKRRWLPAFFVTYLVLLIPFFLVNGILTGTGLSEPVVRYNENEIIGPRLLTIPVEDIFYGMSLILLNVAGMEWLKARNQ